MEFERLSIPEVILFKPKILVDERGFFFDYRTGVPGPVMEETEQLARWIQAKQFDLQRVRAFAATSFDVMDGRATARFVSDVALPALRGEPIRIPPAATHQ